MSIYNLHSSILCFPRFYRGYISKIKYNDIYGTPGIQELKYLPRMGQGLFLLVTITTLLHRNMGQLHNVSTNDIHETADIQELKDLPRLSFIDLGYTQNQGSLIQSSLYPLKRFWPPVCARKIQDSCEVMRGAHLEKSKIAMRSPL